MITPRLVLIGFLMAAPVLGAQVPGTHVTETPKPAIKALPAQVPAEAQAKPFEADSDPLQITISFVKRRHGNVTIEKTYTLAVTTNLADPQIRDDSRIPYQSIGRKPGSAAAAEEKTENGAKTETQYFNSDTDVDIQNFKKSNSMVQLTLRVSMEGIADDVSVPPILRSHKYVISPTLPIGKLATVYSEADVLHDTKVEIQVLIQPLNVQ
jgi:hypothetical protein